MKRALFLILIILYITLFDVLTFYLPHARAEDTSIDLNLPAGWSMISLPVLPENKSLSVLFPDAVVVYSYQKGVGYVCVQENEELVHGKGYWILIDTSQTYNLSGESIESYTMQVDDGWYMIGGCTSSAKAYINTGKIDAIYGYVQGVGYKRLLGSEKLEHGKGYWILLSNTDDQTRIRIDSEDFFIVSINGSPAKGGVPLEVQLSALVMGGIPPYIYEWDLDGNETVDETRQGFSYIYQESGIYTVTLTVKDSAGDVITDSLDIYALYAPAVLALANPTQGAPPLNVEFSCTLTDPDGQIELFEWDFDGDGIYDWSDSNTANATYQYNIAGSYQATIRVTDNDGLTGIDYQEINVGLSPTASASADPMTGAAPLEVAFTGTGVDPDGSISLYEWDFDGDSIYDWSSQATGNTSHTYTFSGIFSATLRVTDNDNLPDTDSVMISVSGPPIAKPRAYPASGDVPLTVRFFTDGEDIDGSLIDFYWDFDGDGTNDWNSKISENCTHTYNIPGTYNATLKVIDNQGLSEIAPITINVTDPNPQGYPTASANTNTNGGAPFMAFLIGEGFDPDGTITKHEWDFDGDGTYDWEGLAPISDTPVSSNIYQSIDVGAYSSPAFVDIDADGDMDMFVGETGGTIYFYRNEGDYNSAIWAHMGQVTDSAGGTIDIGSNSSPAFVDIDADGDMDMFVGGSVGTIHFYRNEGDNNSAVWAHKGQVTDSAGGTIDIGSNSSPSFVDIDADGDMDMFVGEPGGTIYFYSNNGDNTLASWTSNGQVTDSAGNTINVVFWSSPAFVDIDADGDMDMFVGEGNGEIYFYRNGGDNTLASWTSPGQLTIIDVGSRSSPAFVDIDADGDMDMFVGEGGGEIYFYRNDGDTISAIWNPPGQLTDSAGKIIDLGSRSTPAFADIDNDGDMDVFVGEGDGKIYFYRMGKETDPEGKPVSLITYESIKVGTNSSPAFADIDNDGDMDMFVGESYGTIHFYRNEGDSTSAIWTSMGQVIDSAESTIDVGYNSSPAFADIDNDGDMDMFVGESGGRIYLYRNEGDSTSAIWTSIGQLIDSTGGTIYMISHSSPAFADIDADGDMDMFVGESGGRIYFYLNEGDSTSAIWTSMGQVIDSAGSAINVGFYSSPAFADIDADGDMDMFVGESGGRIYFYRNKGDNASAIWTLAGQVIDSTESTIDAGSRSSSTFVDIDADGDMDMFVGESGGRIYLYRNEGDSASAIWTSVGQVMDSTGSTIDVGSNSSPAFVDIDADGDMDMFVGESGGTIHFYRNEGDSTSAIWTSIGQVMDSTGGTIDVGSNSSPAFADIDDDGDMDMFVGEYGGRIHFYRNKGDNTSASLTFIWILADSAGSIINVGTFSSPSFVDIDNDGDMDMFVGDGYGRISLYPNIGDKTSAIWTPAGQLTDSAGSTIDVGDYSTPSFVDIDNDGDMDMFIGESYGRIYSYQKYSVVISTAWADIDTIVSNNLISDTIDIISSSSPSFVDIDNDGDMDMFVGEEGGRIYFYRNEGDKTSAIWISGGQLTDSTRSTMDVGAYSTPSFVDIDNDGDMDLFVGESYGTIYFYQNEGDKSSAIWIPARQVIDSEGSILDVGSRSTPAFADMDGDGDMDMFVGETGGTIYLYRNDGDSTSAIWTSMGQIIDSEGSTIDVGSYSSPVFVDIDYDGDMDMFVGEYDGRIYFYRNDGDKTFASWILITSNYNYISVQNRSTPAFVDIDNDDDYDLFVGNAYGFISFYTVIGSLVHVYSMPGNYQATFRVTDNNGLTDTDSVTIKIYPSGFPSIMASAYPITGDIPLEVSFIGKGIDQDGTIVLYEWDFDGDGTFDWSDNTSGDTSYTYNKAGTHNAILRVTDNEGNKSSNSVKIEAILVISTSRTDIFNPGIGETGTITSNITSDSIITIKIADESGNIIRNLVNNEKRIAGDYSDDWDGKDDSGTLVKDGLYYFLIDYIVDGKTYTYDLRETSQYIEKYPGVTHQSSFSPFENNLYKVTYHISKPSEVSMYIWTWGIGYKDIEHVKTLFVRELRGTGDHTDLWDGADDKGILVPADKQYAIALIIWEVADNGIIITGDRPEISNVSASPNCFNPSYNPYRSHQSQYTVVSFNLSEQANIDCRILNNEGVLIKAITRNELPSGANNIIWDGRDMTGGLVKSGSYRISLKAIDRNGNRSMERSAMVLLYY